MQHQNFLLDSYPPAYMEKIRLDLQFNYGKFRGGYPSFLDHMSSIIAAKGRHLPVSPNQIESYKTVQNFLEFGRSARHSNLRFYHAYIELSKDGNVVSGESLRELIAIGEKIKANQFASFKGSYTSSHDKKSKRVFLEALPSDSTIFGQSWERHESKLNRDAGRVRTSNAGKNIENFKSWTVLTLVPSPSGAFDIAIAALVNPRQAELEFDLFLQRVRESGLREARAQVSSDWIKETRPGFVYWHGVFFQGFVAGVQPRDFVELWGMMYYRLIDPSFDYVGFDLHSEPFKKMSRCHEFYLDRWLDLNFENSLMGIKSLMRKCPSRVIPILPWGFDDLPSSRRFDRYYSSDADKLDNREDIIDFVFPDFVNSEAQMEQVGPPYDHLTVPFAKRKRRSPRQKIAFLMKFVIMNMRFDTEILLNILEKEGAYFAK